MECLSTDEIADVLNPKMTQGDLPPLECTNDAGEEIVGKDGIVEVLRGLECWSSWRRFGEWSVDLSVSADQECLVVFL